MNIQDLQTDDKLADGVWLDFEDAQILVASQGRPAFTKAISKHRKKFNDRQLRDPMQQINLTKLAFADAILLDWKGLKNGKEDFPVTPANKAVLLNIPAFREWIAAASADIANFQKEGETSDAEELKSVPSVESP